MTRRIRKDPALYLPYRWRTLRNEKEILHLDYIAIHCNNIPSRPFDQGQFTKHTAKTKEPTQRAELLINILDLSDSSPDELEIARKVYTEGKKADDKMAIGASLSTLTIHYMQDPERKIHLPFC